MNADQFFFHDLTEFPIVISRHGNAPQGYAVTWIREMEMLVDNPESFVMIVPEMASDTAHEDRKAMVTWQTTNMDRIKARCRAFVAIESEPAALEKIRKQGEKMTRAFGLIFLGMASETEAMEYARQLLQLAPAPSHPA